MKDLFFPYYINRGRLLDIYAILNGGYSEYEEITTTSNSEKQKKDTGEASIEAGFKIFKIGGKAIDEKIKKDADGNQISEKRIQTITSTLKLVLDAMREKKYIKEIMQADDGDFVELTDIVFQINSIKLLMDELDEILKLSNGMSKFIDSSKKADIKSFQNISKSIRSLCNGEEVLYESAQYAVVGNIYDENLYQAIKTDLTNTKFRCLCQIKRKHEQGTTLMKNTIFSRIKDKASKDNFINAVSKFNNNDKFQFDSTSISEIKDKPVYEIEIIALYK